MPIPVHCPRLIEVALPIREISAESVRDKSLRHGHISTLHLWWARRPLAACRAIVFASLVPDPDDPACPPEFRAAVTRLLKDRLPDILKHYTAGRKVHRDADPYRPYDGLDDTPRNRLLTFVAKWSPQWLAFERGQNGQQPGPSEMIDDRCLVKWETSDPKNEQGRAVLAIARELIRTAYDGRVPTVLDPFAGGGAIPLEATRLGCQAIANDYNPVAYLILRATCEFPQKYGQLVPVEKQKKTQPSFLPGSPTAETENRLVRDVGYWANWILERARRRIGHLYPPGQDGHPVVGYLWARTAPCSNPACRAEIPLLRGLLVCDKPNKKVALTLTVTPAPPPVHGGTEGGNVGVRFGIARGRDIARTEGTMLKRGDCRCPICGQVTPVADLRRAGLEGRLGERMVGVITDTPQGKDYRPVELADWAAFEKAGRMASAVERPSEAIPHFRNINLDLYGLCTWGSLFNPRQLLAIQTFVGILHEALAELAQSKPDAGYRQAVAAYLGLWVSRIAQRGSSVGLWHTSRETLEHPFGRQAIPMVWDYPEANPFNEATGGALGQLDWVLRVIEHESAPTKAAFHPADVFNRDGAHLRLDAGLADVAVTDPPYFDAIAYADISDYFYIWLKRGMGGFFPDAFATPLTAKSEEATALKHRHRGNGEEANRHFTAKLAGCFTEAKRITKPSGLTTVMFAHQSTEAWTALINALFEAGLTVTATYPIDTELTTALKSWMSALASSITVICRPRHVGATAALREVRGEIDAAVAEAVRRYYGYGLRGADLVVACYGPAVGVFGRHERVERADGTPVEVPELLELARAAALKAIAGEFSGDSVSRLYFVWANMYGVGEQAWDDARLVAQVGGEGEDAMDMARRRGLFVVDGPRCRLALLRDRDGQRHLGDDAAAPLIDQLHHAMRLWQTEQRTDLLQYLREHDLLEHAPFWSLAQSLFEVLPRGEADWKLVSALLGERETLRREARRTAPPAQATLFE